MIDTIMMIIRITGMNRPIDIKLTFTVSPSLDVAGFNILSQEIREGHSLYPNFVKFQERIGTIESNLILGDSNTELQKKVQGFYSSHLNEITEHCQKTSAQWNFCKDKFLNICDKLFSNKAFVETKDITAYPSLWNVYIHQITQRALSFPLAHDSLDEDESIYVVLHELLHLFFYQYAETEPSLNKRPDLWDIAEIFNSIVLNQNRFKVFYPKHTVTTYPSHLRIINKIKDSALKENDSANIIIEKIIEHI